MFIVFISTVKNTVKTIGPLSTAALCSRMKWRHTKLFDPFLRFFAQT